MGSDLAITYIAVKHELSYVNCGNDSFWDKLRIALHKKLESMNFEELSLEIESNLGVQITLSEAHGLVDYVISLLQSNPRDIGWIKVGTYTVFLTGGMSYGDSPTDSFDDFEKFNALFPGEFIDDVLGE